MNNSLYKNTRINIFFIFSILIGSFACTDRIDISTEASSPRLVIYGYITTDTMRHSIKITRSTGYFENVSPAGISNAKVTISSDTQTHELKENPNTPGLYQTEPDVFGIEGETYTLNVLLDFNEDGEDEEYEATSYLPYAATVDSIGFRPSTILSDYMEVLVWGRISDSEENYLSFHLYRNHELVNDSLQGFFTLDDEFIEKKEIEGVTCFFLDQEEEQYILQQGDIITLRIDAITKEYATFINNAQSELWGSDPIFSGPPANVETNISSKQPVDEIKISGFFSAFSGNSFTTVYP